MVSLPLGEHLLGVEDAATAPGATLSGSGLNRGRVDELRRQRGGRLAEGQTSWYKTL